MNVVMKNTDKSKFVSRMKALDDAAAEMECFLREQAIKAAEHFSMQYPRDEIIFCSAMGGYFWHRDTPTDTEDLNPEIKERFDQALHAYGFEVIPAPIRVKCRNGEVIENVTNW